MATTKTDNVPMFKACNTPVRHCDWCGRVHTGKRPECRDCYGVSLTREPERSDELTGGRWVNVRGVQRWVVDVHNEIDDARNIASMVACPTCHATADRPCRTTTGRHRAPHSTRLIHKRCTCGSRLQAGKKVCDECRAEARRANARVSMRRTRARRSDAA